MGLITCSSFHWIFGKLTLPTVFLFSVPSPHHGITLRLYMSHSTLTRSFSRRQKPSCRYSSQAPGFWARLSSKLVDRPSKVRVPHIFTRPRILILHVDAKASPAGAMGNDASGVGHANTGSPTDQLTRSHRMTVDEASLILNAKKGDTMEQILKVRLTDSHLLRHALTQSTQNYEHLFKINSPPPPPEKGAKPAAGKKTLAYYSHYLQSKVVRARERLEAESKLAEAPADAEPEAPKAEDTSSAPPPPEQGKSS